ncbi:gametogenetin [Gopherus evgoodei]|uniref:gametogenetin n=1 Tax=Gopherus evgoodei TaxID=1825980 RepID=UPI0011CF72D0|nr:gametogenetin [Gopherus evgoodei]
MGNVQSEASQDVDPAQGKDKKGKPGADDGCLAGTPSGAGSESGALPPPPETLAAKEPSQPLNREPGRREKQAASSEICKNCSKPKLPSVWVQNSSSLSRHPDLGDNDSAQELGRGKAEETGLSCLSGNASLATEPSPALDIPGTHQGEPKGQKVTSRSQNLPPEQDLLRSKKPAPKGKSKGEIVSIMKQGGQGDLLGKSAAAPVLLERAQGIGMPKGTSGPDSCSQPALTKTQTQSSVLDNPARSDAPNPSDQGGPKDATERNPTRTALPKPPAMSGGKKQPPPHEEGSPGSHGDSKAPASPCQSPTGQATTQGSRAKEPPGSEEDGVNAEGVQALLEHGLSFLYKVTIQPGQRPPSVKAIKHRAGLISSGISYADALKQCPQKKAPSSVSGSPKVAEKLPSVKGLERRDQEDLSSLTQAFLEQFQKMGTKEQASPATQPQSQAKQQLHLVKILDDLTSFNFRSLEGQKPRVPTPYPQRRKGQSRNSPRFGSDVSRLASFLGNGPKLDELRQDEGHPQPIRAWLADDTRKDVGPNGEPPGEPPQLSPAFMVEPEQLIQAGTTQQRKPETPSQEANPPVRAPGLPTPESPALPSGGAVAASTVQPGKGEDQLMALPGQEAIPPTPAPLVQKCPVAPRSSCPMGAQRQAALEQSSASKGAPGHVRPKARKQAITKLHPRSMWQPKVAASPVQKPQEKLKAHGQPRAKAQKIKLQRQGRETPEPQVAPAEPCQDAASEQGPDGSHNKPQVSTRHWPPFQIMDSCPRKCYCKHQDQRKLPRNISAWLNPSANHLAEPPWVSTAILAGSLVAGTRFVLDSYEQQTGDDD